MYFIVRCVEAMQKVQEVEEAHMLSRTNADSSNQDASNMKHVPSVHEIFQFTVSVSFASIEHCRLSSPVEAEDCQVCVVLRKVPCLQRPALEGALGVLVCGWLGGYIQACTLLFDAF